MIGTDARTRSSTASRPRSASFALALAALAALAVGCLPIPDVRVGIEARTPDYRVAPDRVRTRYVTVPGAVAPDTPEALNRSGVLQYELGGRPDTVMIFVPGLFGGATSLDPLARQLVAAIPGLEVWVLDRRANFLEDRTGFRAAIAARDADAAVGYYLDRVGAPDGHRPLTPADVPFMASWGLDVHLQDLDAVVAAARSRSPRVVLGGHSLGASLASLYASYRHVHAGRSGQDLVDGIVLLDGTLGRTGAFATGERVAGLLGIGVLPRAEDVREGRYPPFLGRYLPPSYFARRGILALQAWYAPDADAPERFTDVPMSNLALAGATFDDGTSSLPLFAVSAGHAAGAEFDGNLPAFLIAGARGAASASIAGVAPGEVRVEWASGDPADEPTDLRRFLRAWTLPSTDYNEWYFPLLLALEISELDARLEGLPGFVPTETVTVPTLAFGAERGLVANLDGFATYVNLRYGTPIATYVLPDYTHLDIVAAAENPVVPVVARWLARSVPAGP